MAITFSEAKNFFMQELKQKGLEYGRLELLLLILYPLLFAGFFSLNTGSHRAVLYVILILYVVLLKTNFKPIEFRKDKSFWAIFFVFLLFGFLSCFWSYDAEWKRIINELKVAPFIALFVVSYVDLIRRYPQLWQICLDFFILSALITGIGLIITHYTIFLDLENPERLKGWGRADNSVQGGLLYGMAVLALFYSKHHAIPYFNNKRLKISVAAILLIVMALTVSRGPLLSLCLTIFSFLIMRKNFKWILILLVLFGSFAGFLMFSSGDVANIKARADSYRFEVWEMALEKIKDRPILGYGAASKFYYDIFQDNKLVMSVSHPHSIYLSTLVQFGLVGFVLLGYCVCYGLFRSYQLLRQDINAVPLAFLLMGLYFGLMDHGGAYTNFSSVWLTMWIPIAASIGLYNLSNPKQAATV